MAAVATGAEMSRSWRSASSGSAPVRSKRKTRKRPTHCFVRVLPPSVALTHPCKHTGPLTVAACEEDPRRLDLPRFESADGRQRAAVSAIYDGVFDGTGAEVDDSIHEAVSNPLADMALKGSCATLFAYGQTGSGKSHNVWHVLLPRTAAALFAGGATSVRVGVVQLYLDRLDDLLAPPPPSASPRSRGKARVEPALRAPHHVRPPPLLQKDTLAREETRLRLADRTAAHHVAHYGEEGTIPLKLPAAGQSDPPGMHWVTCESAAAVMAALSRASSRRVTGGTRMNPTSSRSHAVVYLQVDAPPEGWPEPLEIDAEETAEEDDAPTEEADADDSSSTVSARSVTLSATATVTSSATEPSASGFSGSGSAEPNPSSAISTSTATEFSTTDRTSSSAIPAHAAAYRRRLVRPRGSHRRHQVVPASGSVASSLVAGANGLIAGRVVIVDLAGSERLKKSGSEGASRREAAAINTSLHALSQVIKALAHAEAHLPTRASKLTHLLDGYIRGGSLLHLLVCVSPLAAHLAETSSSLEFARRAMRIQHVPVPVPRLMALPRGSLTRSLSMPTLGAVPPSEVKPANPFGVLLPTDHPIAAALARALGLSTSEITGALDAETERLAAADAAASAYKRRDLSASNGASAESSPSSSAPLSRVASKQSRDYGELAARLGKRDAADLHPSEIDVRSAISLRHELEQVRCAQEKAKCQHDVEMQLMAEVIRSAEAAATGQQVMMARVMRNAEQAKTNEQRAVRSAEQALSVEISEEDPASPEPSVAAAAPSASPRLFAKAESWLEEVQAEEEVVAAAADESYSTEVMDEEQALAAKAEHAANASAPATAAERVPMVPATADAITPPQTNEEQPAATHHLTLPHGLSVSADELSPRFWRSSEAAAAAEGDVQASVLKEAAREAAREAVKEAAPEAVREAVAAFEAAREAMVAFEVAARGVVAPAAYSSVELPGASTFAQTFAETEWLTATATAAAAVAAPSPAATASAVTSVADSPVLRSHRATFRPSETQTIDTPSTAEPTIEIVRRMLAETVGESLERALAPLLAPVPPGLLEPSKVGSIAGAAASDSRGAGGADTNGESGAAPQQRSPRTACMSTLPTTPVTATATPTVTQVEQSSPQTASAPSEEEVTPEPAHQPPPRPDTSASASVDTIDDEPAARSQGSPVIVPPTRRRLAFPRPPERIHHEPRRAVRPEAGPAARQPLIRPADAASPAHRGARSIAPRKGVATRHAFSRRLATVLMLVLLGMVFLANDMLLASSAFASLTHVHSLGGAASVSAAPPAASRRRARPALLWDDLMCGLIRSV